MDHRKQGEGKDFDDPEAIEAVVQELRSFRPYLSRRLEAILKKPTLNFPRDLNEVHYFHNIIFETYKDGGRTYGLDEMRGFITQLYDMIIKKPIFERSRRSGDLNSWKDSSEEYRKFGGKDTKADFTNKWIQTGWMSERGHTKDEQVQEWVETTGVDYSSIPLQNAAVQKMFSKPHEKFCSLKAATNVASGGEVFEGKTKSSKDTISAQQVYRCGVPTLSKSSQSHRSSASAQQQNVQSVNLHQDNPWFSFVHSPTTVRKENDEDLKEKSSLDGVLAKSRTPEESKSTDESRSLESVSSSNRSLPHPSLAQWPNVESVLMYKGNPWLHFWHPPDIMRMRKGLGIIEKEKSSVDSVVTVPPKKYKLAEEPSFIGSVLSWDKSQSQLPQSSSFPQIPAPANIPSYSPTSPTYISNHEIEALAKEEENRAITKMKMKMWITRSNIKKKQHSILERTPQEKKSVSHQPKQRSESKFKDKPNDKYDNFVSNQGQTVKKDKKLKNTSSKDVKASPSMSQFQFSTDIEKFSRRLWDGSVVVEQADASTATKQSRIRIPKKKTKELNPFANTTSTSSTDLRSVQEDPDSWETETSWDEGGIAEGKHKRIEESTIMKQDLPDAEPQPKL